MAGWAGYAATACSSRSLVTAYLALWAKSAARSVGSFSWLWCNLHVPLSSELYGGFEGGAMARFLGLGELVDRRHFDRDYRSLRALVFCASSLGSGDLVEMMAERGLSMAHTTIVRWVRRYVPEFERRWNRFERSAGAWCEPSRSQILRWALGIHRSLDYGIVSR